MLGWSLTLFRVGETAVRIHPTFFLLLAIIGLLQGLRGAVFVALLFLCVLLHEFGHVLAARRYGIRTQDVTLWPFGGIASLERIPEKPGQEIVVALAGPAVNVLIVLVLALVIGVSFDFGELAQIEQAQASLIGQLAAANVFLIIFNLIPAFPMDGGRVLRALLAIPLGYPRATRIAASIGQGLAIALGLLGLFGNPMLIIIAIFVFLAASSESGFVQARDLTRHHAARDAMITSFESLPVTASTDDAAQMLLRTTQQEFPVVDGSGRLRGIVTRDGIITTLGATGGATPVLEMMLAPVPVVSPHARLEAVFSDMQRSTWRCVGVVDESQRFLGYITQENIAELVLIRSSMQRAEKR